MTVRYDTSSEPARRRLALWQDIVCDVFVQLDCKSDLADFNGSVAQSKFGEMSLTRVDSSRQRVFRNRPPRRGDVFRPGTTLSTPWKRRVQAGRSPPYGAFDVFQPGQKKTRPDDRTGQVCASLATEPYAI